MPKKSFKRIDSSSFVPQGRFSKRRLTAIVLALCIFSALLTGVLIYVIASPSATSLYVEEGIYPGAPSYTIWKESSTYYAKDANGHIDYLGTNGTEIVENCNTALGTSGGKIFFKAGIHTDALVVASNIVYEGEGIGTVFRALTGGDTYDTTYYLVYGSSVQNVTIKNIKVDGAISVHGHDYVGFAFEDSSCITIDNVETTDLRWGITFRRVTSSTIMHSYSHDNAYYNVYLYDSNYTIVNDVISIKSSYNGIAIEQGIGSGSFHNKILNCISNNNTKAGFGGWNIAQYNTIVDNIGYYNGEHGMYFANENPSTQPKYNIVSNNQFSFNTYGGIHYYAGSSNLFTNNIMVSDGTFGILVESSVARGVSHNNTFSNNLIVNSGQQGIYIYGLSTEYGEQNKAVGNTILNPEGDGIQFEYQNYFVISNNDIEMVASGVAQEGIRLLTRCRNGTIVGNTIRQPPGNGIMITSWALNLVVEANQISQSGGNGIEISYTSSNITVVGNRIVDSTNYDIYFQVNADGCYIAVNHVGSIYLNHTTTTCDYNRFFGNIVSDLSQEGSGTGNTFVENYPDNTP